MAPSQTGVRADELVQALVENSSEAVVLLDADGVIRFASQSSARILGHPLEDRMGQRALDHVHPQDVDLARTNFADCLQRPGVALRAEYRVRHRDGSWRVLEAISINRLQDPAVAAIVVNYRDITQRKQSEEARLESEARLRHLVEHAQDLIYYCNPGGRFTYVNPTAVRVMQYAEDELVGRHFVTLIRADYQEHATRFYRRQMEEKTPSTYFEFPAVAKDGHAVWVGQHVQLVFSGGDIVGVQAIARDITRQKDTEERLRRSEARYRSIIQGAAYGIYRTSLDGAILDANPALASMLGFDTVDDVLRHTITDFYRSPADRAEIIERYRAAGGSGTLAAELHWKRKDGTPMIVRLAARRVDLEDGSTCFEGVAEDITARRALEEQLRQAQKMEAVGRLARGIAHDFNNVLAAIMGSSDLMVAQLKPGEPLREDAEEIGKAAERGAALTRRLLAFSRRQLVEPQVLDVHAVVSGCDAMLRRLVGDDTIVRVHTPGPRALVRIEPGQLEQIVVNLVVNARDAMPGGGTVDITVEAVDLDQAGVLRFAGLPPGRYVRISVRDTGTGIEPELQDHVFEPFFTTKDEAQGTGLGLSIVYGIAKDAGGSVALSSAPGQGATFDVLLPQYLE